MMADFLFALTGAARKSARVVPVTDRIHRSQPPPVCRAPVRIRDLLELKRERGGTGN